MTTNIVFEGSRFCILKSTILYLTKEEKQIVPIIQPCAINLNDVMLSDVQLNQFATVGLRELVSNRNQSARYFANFLPFQFSTNSTSSATGGTCKTLFSLSWCWEGLEGSFCRSQFDIVGMFAGTTSTAPTSPASTTWTSCCTRSPRRRNKEE